MTDPKNPFEAMIAQAHEMAKAFNPSIVSEVSTFLVVIWPTMPKDFMEMMFGNALNKDGLDAKTRLFLTLAALTVLGGQAESQIRVTVRHLLEAGAKKQEIVEAIGQMSVFAGIPAMTKVLELAQEVLAVKEGSDT